MASSSSLAAKSVYLRDHEVFLSFRGEDTRHSFTSHLYTSLVQNDIKVFIDDEGLERGDEISQALKDAIERSKISVIVFSKDYGSSSWCLDELVHILQCRRENNQIVLPVFYRIDPSDVRKQKGNYKTSFDNHQERFRDKIGKLNIWRDALKEAANLSGWDSNVIRSESELVKKIVEDVLKKLNRFQKEDDFTGFVGLERRFKKIEDLLLVDSPEPLRTIGIWGTGGIGKTTLARIVFQRFYSEFDAACFVEDIRVEWEQGRKKYYDSKNTLFDHKRLRGKRVLIVLDNVNNPEQLEILDGDANRFGPGSRIIVTSRDMQILRGEVDDTHRVETLDFEESYQLFRSIALRKTHIETHFSSGLYETIINYAEGIPLALKVLSSFVRGKEKENWVVELNKWKECPNIKIMNILRTSYEGLDEKQKCIFLDVACFFKNTFRADAERILEACGLYPKTGLDDLIDKSLISVNIDDKLCIHDLIQQMAFSVVKSETELENHSRLWLSQDACHILETNRGTSAIEGIFLDLSVISQIEFDSASFQCMFKLRILKIFLSDVRKTCHVTVNGDNCDLLFFPSSLRYLHWEAFPWKSLPQNFRPQNLVELNLTFSNVVQLWKGIQPLGNLMKIDVSFSRNLIELPDLSQASKLEHVYLEHCTSLREAPSSLENLCNLKTLNLNGCSSVHEFPNLPKSIVCLVLSGTAMKLIPPSITYLNLLEILNLSGCRNLVCLPSFSTMQSLKAIALPDTKVSTLLSVNENWFPKTETSQVSHNQTGQNWFPETETSQVSHNQTSQSWLPKLIKKEKKENRSPKTETSRVFHNQVSHYIEVHARELPHNILSPEYCYGFCGLPKSVAIVSLSRAVHTKYLATFFGNRPQDLMFFNSLGFYDRGRKKDDTDNADLKLHSERIVYKEFTRVVPIETKIGFCCLRDKFPEEIPDQFDHQCNGDTISLGFVTGQFHRKEILGFALCAVVNFTDDDNSRKLTIPQPVYEDNYKNINLFCELISPGPIAFHFQRSFRFWVGQDENSNCGARVIKCGVKIIYGNNLLTKREQDAGKEIQLRALLEKLDQPSKKATEKLQSDVMRLVMNLCSVQSSAHVEIGGCGIRTTLGRIFSTALKHYIFCLFLICVAIVCSECWLYYKLDTVYQSSVVQIDGGS